jgi:hypothetical protein
LAYEAFVQVEVDPTPDAYRHSVLNDFIIPEIENLKRAGVSQ